MENPKIQLSAEEWQLLSSREWILTKQRITEKAFLLFGRLATGLQQKVEEFPANWQKDIGQPSPKISRGENFAGLPYMVLDYPRVYTRESVFAVRTLLWWSRYFSICLHLKGPFLQRCSPGLPACIARLTLSNAFYCCKGNEWNADLDSPEYLPLSGWPSGFDLQTAPFLKIAVKIDLADWDKVESTGGEIYSHLMEIIPR
jgi:hypothetical protein